MRLELSPPPMNSKLNIIDSSSHLNVMSSDNDPLRIQMENI